MTFVGKILVCLIVVFSLVFLTVSLVAFTATRNWAEEVAVQKKAVQAKSTELSTVKAELDARKGELDAAKSEFQKQETALKSRITEQDAETKQAKTQLSEQIGNLEKAQENVRVAQAEAEARRTESDNLRKINSDIAERENGLKIKQTDLNDQIRELQRDLQVAQENNRDLRDRNASLTGELKKHGLATDVRSFQANASSPKNDVEGVVTKVDGALIEISVGSDDGVAERNELEVYRLNPPEYLGKVQIVSVSNDQAVAKVVGKTRQGLKIKEGDIVATKIRTRG
jgi:hypothetical protein